MRAPITPAQAWAALAEYYGWVDGTKKELPVLPEPLVERVSGHREPFVFYDADQLQAYGAACAALAREMALEEVAIALSALDFTTVSSAVEAIRKLKEGK